MSTRLFLVRHGATDWSDAGRLNGWTDLALNERGMVQAKALRTRLPALAFAGVWSSDLARATETARLAIGEPDPYARLRELDFGSLEGKRWDECPRTIRRALIAFDEFRAPDGESVGALRERVYGFIDALPRGDHLLFTHGGVIRLLLRESGWDRPVLPGDLVWLEVDGCVSGGVVRVPTRTSAR